MRGSWQQQLVRLVGGGGRVRRHKGAQKQTLASRLFAEFQKRARRPNPVSGTVSILPFAASPCSELLINADANDEPAPAGGVADCHARTRVRTRMRSKTCAHKCQGRRRHASLRPPPAPRLRCAAAWSKCRLGSAPARTLRLLGARLAALGSSVLPGRDRATGTPGIASGARASRLHSRRFHRL